jgi:NAD(P)-dependent dehydrogenase (short-subunit alcohol dehydrogenase family)
MATTAPPTSTPIGDELPFLAQRPRMTGRVVLVTGGTRGIGAAISRSFAAQGAIVAAGYGRDAEHAERLVSDLREHGAHASIHRGNVGSAEECRRTVAEVIEQHVGASAHHRAGIRPDHQHFLYPFSRRGLAR